MEKRIVHKKGKKYNLDSLLPRSGLNPGSSFLPDKGPQGWGSINHAMGDGNVSGTIAEDVDELNEASGFPRNAKQAISSCFSSNTIQLMDKYNKDDIKNSDINDIINLEKKDYLPDILTPNTRDLVFNSNQWGDGTQQSRASRTVNHHLLGINPKSESASNPLTEVTVQIPLNDLSELTNEVFRLIKDKALLNSDINNAYNAYREALYNRLAPAYREAKSASEQSDINNRVFELKAWLIRKVWQNDEIFDLRTNYSKEHSNKVGKYILDHPELALSKNNTPIIFNGKPFYFIIQTIDDSQLKTLESKLIGNKLKVFPATLAKDFVCAMSADGKEKYNTYEDFKNAYSSLIEQLNEDENKHNKISAPDLRRYLENNLYNKPKGSTFDKHILDLVSNYFTKERVANYWPELSKRYYDVKDIINRFWWSRDNKELDDIKKRIIAQYIRYKIEREPFSLYYDGEPYFDSADNLYKLKPGNLIVKNDSPYDDREFEVDAPRDTYFSIEDIYDFIHNKKVIDINILDKHFLDASGNIVKGIKFLYAIEGSRKVITGVLTTDKCDISAISKVIVDSAVTYSGSYQYGSLSIKTDSIPMMLAKKGIKHITEYEMVGNDLVAGMFRQIDADTITFTNFSRTSFPERCFRNAYMRTIPIPLCVDTLHEECFAYSQLKEIYIPETVKNLRKGCFAGCSDLTVNFAIEKDLLSDYPGYKDKWGKSDVKSITYGNDVIIEKLEEAISSVSDYGTPVAENEKYVVYKLSRKEQFENLSKILLDEGIEQRVIDFLLGESYYWKDRVKYFIEDKDDIQLLKVFDPSDSSWGYKLKVRGPNKNQYSNSPYDLSTELLGNVLKDDQLREVLLFDANIPELNNVKEILKTKGITSKTPYNDKKYYINEFIGSANDFVSDTDDKKALKMFTYYLEKQDYISALEVAGIELPKYNNFKSDIEKALNSKEGQELFNRIPNIDIKDAIEAIDNYGELHDLIEQAANKTLIENMIADVNKFLSGNIETNNGVDVDFNKQYAKVNILNLLNDKNAEDLNQETLEDRVDRYIMTNLRDTVKKYELGDKDYNKDKIIKNNVSYKLNKKDFLNTLEEYINYYYN